MKLVVQYVTLQTFIRKDLMMDKLIVTQQDVDMILAWRDENKDLVRNFRPAFESIIIANKDTKVSLTCIYNYNKVPDNFKIGLNIDGISYGSLLLKKVLNGCAVQKNSLQNDKIQNYLLKQGSELMRLPKDERRWLVQKSTDDLIASMITVYCSTMAYVSNYRRNSGLNEAVNLDSKVRSETVVKTPRAIQRQIGFPKSRSKQKADNTVYLFTNRAGKRVLAATCRSGRECKINHAFSVRGHFRTYSSGKTVWIKPFVKGVGNRKDKNYKL